MANEVKKVTHQWQNLGDLTWECRQCGKVVFGANPQTEDKVKTCEFDEHQLVIEDEKTNLVRCSRCGKVIDCEFKPSLMEQAKKNR